jgi:hypothetical protein
MKMSHFSSGMDLAPDSFQWTPPAIPETSDEPPVTFNELKRWALLKRRLKRGPKMTRRQRVEYLRRLARKEWA